MMRTFFILLLAFFSIGASSPKVAKRDQGILSAGRSLTFSSASFLPQRSARSCQLPEVGGDLRNALRQKISPPKSQEPNRAQYIPLASQLPMSADAPMIVIDAGHGGTDLGAKARPPYCEEKKISLQTARLVKKYLTQLGYRVSMTRDSDAFVPLPRRVEIASQADGDLFVSIHFNSTRNETVKGIEIFYSEQGDQRSRVTSSKRLADAVLSRVIDRTTAISRGVKRGNFYVIRETTMPAILVEGGFISNAEERAALRGKDYQDKIARGIADGIDAYFKKRS